jgi:hypothetical protein
MNATSAPTRCLTCGETLAFSEWSRGAERCTLCLRRATRPSHPQARERAAASTDRFEPSRPVRHPAAPDRGVDHTELLDEIPDDLIDELTAALEAEVALRKDRAAQPGNPVRDVIDEIGLGKSPAELSWAAWGFSGGFAANVALAKYAQMSSGAPISEFFGPIVIGGVASGLACAAIAWGLAKIRAG